MSHRLLRTRPSPWRPVAAMTALAAALLALSCGAADERPADSGATAGAPELRGATVSPPIPKPDFTLMSTAGEPFDFRKETEGLVTLLFFGYTNCPDVCPVHMANLGAVLEKLPPAVANRIKVVFVTTDPERDTPERLRSWLDNFDRRFVGLTGPQAAIDSAQLAMGLRPAMKEHLPGGDEQEYGVGHAAMVVAFTPDNLAHVVYPFGIRQTDWAHDLPALVRDGWPGS